MNRIFIIEAILIPGVNFLQNNWNDFGNQNFNLAQYPSVVIIEEN